MALWLKQEDGTLVEVSGGGGGSFDGEHVPTGDPTDPAMFEALDVGQLLYDGVESDGSDGGPHDHDYLPLSGGTLTGDLQVDGQVRAPTRASTGAPNYTFTGATGMGMWGAPDGIMGFATGGQERVRISDTIVSTSVRLQTPTTYDNGAPTYTFAGATGAGMWCYDNNLMGFTVSGVEFFRNEGGVSRFKGDLQVDGQMSFGVTSAGDWPLKLYDGSPTYFHGIGVGVNSLTFHVGASLAAELGPGGWAFGIADDIDTQDVLDRAEVATMPVVDDDSVAATDADVDVLTVNEVVTAMLAKIKELSAEIKELKGA
jgi:hypothetical protein